MPGIKSDIHLFHLTHKKEGELYGLQWGDPEEIGFLKLVRDEYLLPRITEDTVIAEIGPGGGRWTRYMLHAKKIYAVDPFEELLDELKANIENPNIEIVHNSGTDFPGIPERSVDFVFSFGVFVHLDLPVIDAYLESMKSVLKDDGVAFFNYADKTKPAGFKNKGFAANYPNRMREMLKEHGYTILMENNTLLPHSCCVMFRKEREGELHFPTGVLPQLPIDLYQVRK